MNRGNFHQQSIACAHTKRVSFGLLGLLIFSGDCHAQDPLDPFEKQQITRIVKEEISRSKSGQKNPYADAPSSNPYSNLRSGVEAKSQAIRQEYLLRENRRFQAETVWRKEIILARGLLAQGKVIEALQTAKEALTYCHKYLGKNSGEAMNNYTVLAEIYMAQSDFINAGQMKIERINVALGQQNPDYFGIGDMYASLSNYSSEHKYGDLSQTYDGEAKRYWKIAAKGWLRSYHATVKENNIDDLETVITLSHNLNAAASRLGVQKTADYWAGKKAAWEKRRR
jgi:hypothetical protein